MRKWALDTLAKKTYLISDNYIYFMYEQDLLAFKLKFGKYL